MPKTNASLLSRANVANARFRIYNRVAVTKPIDHVMSILGFEDSDDSPIEKPSGLSDSEEETEQQRMQVAVYLAATMQTKFFGVRMGMKVESPSHIVAVDAALEFQWRTEVEHYERDKLRSFTATHAASRVTIGTWTVLEELAKTVDLDISEISLIPPKVVVDTVLAKLDEADHSSIE